MTSLVINQLRSRNQSLTQKVNTDPLRFPTLRDTSPTTCTCNKAKCTTGVHVEYLWVTHGVMASVTFYPLGADPSLLMSTPVLITSSATAKYQATPPSAMALISKSYSFTIKLIEASMKSGVCLHSMLDSDIWYGIIIHDYSSF